MSKADEVKAKGALLAGGPSQPVSPRTDPYRLSVDLPPKEYQGLQEWIASVVPVLRRRVSGVKVFRALLARLLTDEALQRDIIDDLRKLG